VYTDIDSKIFWLKERLIKVVLWGIFISAFLIGFSGAMMPGPMLGVTIDGSLKKGVDSRPFDSIRAWNTGIYINCHHDIRA